jgi:hypothetical protein
LDFLRRQAVEGVNLLVYLALQRGRVGAGVALLRGEDAVNEGDDGGLGGGHPGLC